MPCLDPSHRMAQRLASSLISGASLSETSFRHICGYFCNSPPPRPLYARLHLSVRLPYHWPLPPICLHKALKKAEYFLLFENTLFQPLARFFRQSATISRKTMPLPSERPNLPQPIKPCVPLVSSSSRSPSCQRLFSGCRRAGGYFCRIGNCFDGFVNLFHNLFFGNSLPAERF